MVSGNINTSTSHVIYMVPVIHVYKLYSCDAPSLLATAISSGTALLHDVALLLGASSCLTPWPCVLLVQVMAREIFNPNLALFVSVPEGGTTFQPNPNSVVQSDTGVSHLEFFKFVGRLVGKALYDGQLMDAHFTRSFYKHMLGQQLTYEVSNMIIA